VLLTFGSAFYEEVADEDMSHYDTLGVKRMGKGQEIQIAYDKLKSLETSEEKLENIEEAFKVLNNPQKRRVYDRSTPATRDELYYKGMTYLNADNYQEQVINSAKQFPWLVEVHGGTHRPPRAGTIHVPPNWGRLLSKAGKVLQGYVKLGRINVDSDPEFAASLGLAEKLAGGRDPVVVAINPDGKVVVYENEPRILQLCDFVGEQITDVVVEKLSYNDFSEWHSKEKRVKVVLFRKNFTRMVMVYREAAESFGKENPLFSFAEVDVRSRGSINLWRRQGMKRMPLVAVLRDDDKVEPGLLGGSFNRKMLDNFLLANRVPVDFPRISSENFEETCVLGVHRYCVILAADPRYVPYNQVQSSLDVFVKASKMVLDSPIVKDASLKFAWADKMAEYVNTTEVWKSMHRVFGTKPEFYSIHLFVTDGELYTYKDFGGNLFKVTDWTEKETEVKEFVEEFVSGKLKAMKLPTPMFREPAPPPMSQEDISKAFVGGIVCTVVLIVLGWSFVTFKKEEAVREELIKSGVMKRRKEKRDGNYDIGE